MIGGSCGAFSACTVGESAGGGGVGRGGGASSFFSDGAAAPDGAPSG